MSENLYDVIIVGGAAAGLTAGIYTTRRTLNTLLLTKDTGGQAAGATVQNYPGILETTGLELMKKFSEQGKKFGLKIKNEEVIKIEEHKKDNKPIFYVETVKNKYNSRSLILAFGRTPKNLNIPGEKEFFSRGVSYCANCDAPLFINKTVAVVGGGNAAFDAALFCSDVAKRVYLIHRRKEFRAFEIVVNEVKKRKNIEMVLDSVVKEIKGNQIVKSILVENILTKEKKEIHLDGIFVEIGSEVKTDFIKNFVKLDNEGQIIINDLCETSRPGVFAAGDVTTTPFKQIVVASGEGAKAGLQVYNYLIGAHPRFSADWYVEKKDELTKKKLFEKKL